MSNVRSTISIKSGVAIGQGKLSACDGTDGEKYVAIVHQDASVEVIVLNGIGRVLQSNFVDLKDLIDARVNHLQVLWCTEESQRTLIVSCTNQVALARRDHSLQKWNVVADVIVPGVDENGLISTLTFHLDNIYIGGNQGLWQIGMNLSRQTHLFKHPVTAIRASDTWLALGQEQGKISVMRKAGEQWFDYGHMQSIPQCCCTDLLIESNSQVLVAAYSTGQIRLFSLVNAALLLEFAAHIRWINKLIQVNDGFLSIADDSFAHLWKFGDERASVDYVNSIQIKNCLVMNGAPFNVEADSNLYCAFLLTVYDRSEMYIVSV